MTSTNWENEAVEGAAAYLYRDEFQWSRDAVWSALSAEKQRVYLDRARRIGYIFNFPYHSRHVFELAGVCPCDEDPETTQGPERECLLHGELPWAVQRLNLTEVVEKQARDLMADLDSPAPDYGYRNTLKTRLRATLKMIDAL